MPLASRLDNLGTETAFAVSLAAAHWGAQGNRTAGIGVQFSEQDAAANAKIENHLAGSLSSDRPTHTM